MNYDNPNPEVNAGLDKGSEGRREKHFQCCLCSSCIFHSLQFQKRSYFSLSSLRSIVEVASVEKRDGSRRTSEELLRACDRKKCCLKNISFILIAEYSQINTTSAFKLSIKKVSFCCPFFHFCIFVQLPSVN